MRMYKSAAVFLVTLLGITLYTQTFTPTYNVYLPIIQRSNVGPIPFVTPIPNANYKVTKWYHLTPCENHGMLRLKVTVFDSAGFPLNDINVVRYTSAGDFAGNALTGDKGPGQVEFTFEGPPLGGNWHVTVEMPGTISETAWNLRTDLGDEECEVTGELGNTFKHHSYDIEFMLEDGG